MQKSLRCRMLFTVLVVANLVAAAKSGPGAAEEIKNADQQWEQAAAARDVDRSTSFCGSDAAILVPNEPAAQGKDAIRKWFQDTFNVPGFKLSWQVTNTEAAKSGDLGYSTGTYELSFTDPSGKTVSDHGKYVTVWKKQADGSWKVVRDIFNSDVSASH